MIEFSKVNNLIKREYEAIHIVCGESTAGSLRVGLGYKNKVIGFPDDFAIGPILELHKDVGRAFRYEWLKDHINISMDYIEEEYESWLSKTIGEIDEIPNNIPIVIWTAENAQEQTGIRYILQLLQNKTNDIFLVNTSIAFQELFNTSEVTYIISHSGGVHPEKLQLIYDKKLTTPLSNEERSRFNKEWAALADTKEVLRIWENEEIKGVPETYFDRLIITTAQKQHQEQGKRDFIKSARLIGEVLGILNGSVSDAFLEYRVRCLIYRGAFEIKGIPKAMRYYSVKLR